MSTPSYTGGRFWRLALAMAALALVAAAPTLTAQTARTIALDEAIRIALDQNSVLRRAENASDLDAIAVRQQRMQLLPSLSVNTNSSQSYGRNFSEDEGRIINQTTQSVNAGLSSSVVLFDGFGNMAALREARIVEDAGESSLARARQTVVFTVLSNYLAMVEQQEQLRVRQEDLVAQQAQEAQIQAFVDAGARTIADLYQQQATVASAQLALVQTERAVALAQVDIMQTLQLDPRGDYVFATPAIDTAAAAEPQYDLATLLDQSYAERPDLDAQTALLNAAEEGMRVAQSGRWPTVSLSAGYNSGYNSATDFSFLDQFDQRRGGSVGLGVSLPIFDRSSTDIATQRARVTVQNARIGLEELRSDVALQVRRALLDHQAARSQLAAAQAQLRAAELALSSSSERYDVGAATLLELSQARAVQVQAASALVSARYNLVFQRTLLDYYTGDLDPASVTLG